MKKDLIKKIALELSELPPDLIEHKLNPKEFKATPFQKMYTKDELIEFAIYCSGHRKQMIEFRFDEFLNKNLLKK